MFRLVESIKLLDGKFCNLSFHQQRMARSYESLYGTQCSVNLQAYLSRLEYPRKGLYKCRVEYDHASIETTFSVYEARKIKRLKIVEDNLIAYGFKSTDRSALERLFLQRGDCDDVLIVKQGRVTDCSFSNIAFRKGSEWFTPDTPLLKGTMREKLISENKIVAREIRVEDIRSFDALKIINAMLEFESPEIEVSNIVF